MVYGLSGGRWPMDAGKMVPGIEGGPRGHAATWRPHEIS